MPKDPSKNIDRYKIAGGELNEFEFNQNQQELAEQQKGTEEHLIPGTPPEQTVDEVIQQAKKVVAKRAKAAAGKRTAKKAPAKRPTATKKTATKKAAK